jgi:hypothetical protein
MSIWYILRLFGIFFTFWYAVPRKIWQPCPEQPDDDDAINQEKMNPNWFLIGTKEELSPLM